MYYCGYLAPSHFMKEWKNFPKEELDVELEQNQSALKNAAGEARVQKLRRARRKK
jgi:hypothetical protein